MPFKPNYNQKRAERNRTKQAKKEAKLQEKEEARDRRKAELDTAPGGPESSEDAPSEP